MAQLRFPPEDVAALERILLDEKTGRYDKVITLFNKNRSEILREYNALLRGERGSEVLFYYSGHGKPSDLRKLYLVANDTTEEELLITGVPFSTIIDLKENYGVRTFTAILDCCFAGLGSSDVKGSEDDELRAMGSGRGVFFLGAANATEIAKEDQALGHGVLTAGILEGLSTGLADKDNDGQVSGNDLFSWCADYARRRGAQRVVMAGQAESGEVIVAYSRRRIAPEVIERLRTKIATAYTDEWLPQQELDELRNYFLVPVVVIHPPEGSLPDRFLAYTERRINLREFLARREEAGSPPTAPPPPPSAPLSEEQMSPETQISLSPNDSPLSGDRIHFSNVGVTYTNDSCFVIMPYGKKNVDGEEVNFDEIYEYVIKKAVQDADLTCVRCDDIEFPGSIDESMITHIFEDRVAIVDTSTLNANVFYELGVRHALKRRVTVLIQSAGTKEPFDIGRMRSISYPTDLKGAPAAVNKIARFIKNALDNEDPKDADSLVYKVLPELAVRMGPDLAPSKNYSDRLRWLMDEVFRKEPIKAENDLEKYRLASHILLDIVDTVHQFLGSWGGGSSGADLDANYMIAYTRQKIPERFLKMVPPQARENGCFLVLHHWAHVSPGVELVLPIAEIGEALPGPPELWASCSPMEVVPDTLAIRYAQDIPPAVRDWQKAYFRSQKRHLRSFASMPINYELEQVGVLNIQSSAVNVLGENKKHQREIQELLEPLRFGLGVIINSLFKDGEKPWRGEATV